MEQETNVKKTHKKINSPFLRLIFSRALHQSEEERNVQIDMLRYRNNTFSTSLGYIALLAQIVAFCFVYSCLQVNSEHHVTLFGIDHAGLWCGVDIFVNIAMLLFLFLTISRMKVYDRNWGIASICFGVIEIIRLFLYPLALYSANTETITSMPTWIFIIEVVCYIACGALLIIAGIVTIILSNILNKYLESLKTAEVKK